MLVLELRDLNGVFIRLPILYGVCKILPNESYGSMFELGMFQHRMVVSTPPEKQKSPLGDTVNDSTGPV